MPTEILDHEPSPGKSKKRAPIAPLTIGSQLHRRVGYAQYRDKVRRVYDGPRGAVLATASLLSLHQPLGERLLRKRRFDLRGVKRVLDIGSGAGQIALSLAKYMDPRAHVVCMDLSAVMLRRARGRFRGKIPSFVAGDLSQLPFADGSFDCATCGYVLEHLPDPTPGLREVARVLAPGGRLLLFATEDSFFGAWTSRLWCCRTYNRDELKAVCAKVGLEWRRELWFTRLHRWLRVGGILVELVKKETD